MSTMSQVRPPTRVKAVRKRHMDLVEEHRILNGHYRRLMMAKQKRQQNSASGQSEASSRRSPSPFRPEFRSRSAGSWARNGPHQQSPDMEPRRNVTSPVKIVVSPSLDSTLQRSVSRLDLHRATTVRSQDARLTSSMTNLKAAGTATRPVSAPKAQAYQTRKLSSQYERRHLDSDIADKNFHLFNQPTRPFQPKLLLFNLTESKLAQETKHYQPPFWKMRLQQMRAQKLGLKQDTNKMNGDEMDDYDETEENGETLSPSEKGAARRGHVQVSPSVSFRLGRGRMSPNVLSHLSPMAARELLFDRVYRYNEQDEWRFMKEVTRDIIIAQSCSERMLFHIFSQAIKRWRNKLPVPRMRMLLTKLMDDIQAPKDGILSVYVEHEPSEVTVRKDAATITVHDVSVEADYTDDEFEKESEGSDGEIQSLADEDMENLIEGKNLDQLYEKMESSAKKKDQKEKVPVKSSQNTVKVSTVRKNQKVVEKEDVSSVKSESIHSEEPEKEDSLHSEVSKRSSRASVQSAFSESAGARRSSSKKGHNVSDHVQSGEETVAEISDLEDDDKEKSNRKNSNNHIDNQSARKSSSGSAGKVSTKDEKKLRDSLDSSVSQEFRLDTSPPEKLDSNESDIPAKETRKSITTPPSRALSLKSISGQQTPIRPAPITKRTTGSLSSEKSETASTAQLTVPEHDQVQSEHARSSISSITAEEIRQKREIFLKRFEQTDKKNSIEENGDRKSIASSSMKSLSRRGSNGNGHQNNGNQITGNGQGAAESHKVARQLSKDSANGRAVQSIQSRRSSVQEAEKNGQRTRGNSMSGTVPASPRPEAPVASVENLNSEDAKHQIESSPTPPKPQPRRSLSRSSTGMVSAAGVFSTRPSRTSRQSSVQSFTAEEKHVAINGTNNIQAGAVTSAHPSNSEAVGSGRSSTAETQPHAMLDEIQGLM